MATLLLFCMAQLLAAQIDDTAAQADNAVAYAQVTLLIGSASAQRAEPLGRQLIAGDAVYAGETLVTGDAAHLHLRTADAGLISLRPASVLQIVHSSPHQQDAGRVQLRLLGGSVRVISGELDDEDFLLALPAGSLQAIEADFQVTTASPTEHRIAVNSGTVSIATPEGEIVIGTSSEWQLAATRAGLAPQGLFMPSGSNPESGIVLRLP